MVSCFGFVAPRWKQARFPFTANREMRVSDRSKLGWLLLVALLMSSTNIHAQIVSARLKGVIRDASGATIPGATVTAAEADSHARLVQTADANGLYLFPALPPGEFTITVEANGFRKRIYSHLILTTGQTVDLDVVMQPGEATSEPTRSNAGPQIVFPDAQISGAFTPWDVSVLPLLARMPTILAAYEPGVLVNGGNEGLSTTNGTRQGSNNTTLDGMDVNDPVTPSLGVSLASMNTDTISQVRAITAGGDAEYGRNAGSQVILVTRSGGNRWFGSAYEYAQNATFNANDFFNSAVNGKRPQDNQNTFGFTGGGPIIKDRTTVFGNFEGTILRKEIVRNRTVLTSDAKSGLFSWLPLNSTTVSTFNIVGNDPRGLGINPQVAKVLNLLPNPNNYNVGDGLNTAGYQFNNPTDARSDQFTVRVDHNLTSNHRIFYRHSWSDSNGTDWRNNADATYPGMASGRDIEHRWGFALGSDWAISPYFVNEFRAGRQTSLSSFTRPARLSTPMMISGLWTDPLNPDFPSDRSTAINQISDNVTLFRNKHTFRFGASISFTNQGLSSSTGIFPDITFGTAYGNAPPSSIGPGITAISPAQRSTFESLYNALLGRPETITQTFYSNLTNFQSSGTPRVRSYSHSEFALFFQDEWKLRKNLSLTMGLRYEVSTAPSEQNGLQGTFNQASSLTDQSAQIGNLTMQPGGSLYGSDLHNFAPRIGFAWNPPGHSTLTLRGGYGIFYDRLVDAATNFVDANTPGFSQTVTVFPNQSSADVRLSDPYMLPVHTVAPASTQPDTRSTAAAVFDPGLRTGMVHQFSLTLQKRVSPNTILEASYVGTRGVDLFMNVNLDQPKVAGDFLTSFKQIQAFRTSLTPVPSSNTLVRLFGSTGAAINAIGGDAFDQGLAGVAADTVDRTYFSRYASAGLSDYYLRNFPQFNQLIVGTNQGRSYYDSAQLRASHRMGALQVNASYIFGRSRDNISVDGGGFTSPIDNYNVSLNKGYGDADREHVVSLAATFTLPSASRTWLRDAPRWAAEIPGGWDLGLLGVWESGAPFTVSSGHQTSAAGVPSWADLIGAHNFGAPIRSTNGVFYFYTEQIASFSFPGAGEIGTTGRNSFRGPDYFDIDATLVKNIQLKGTQKLSLRLDAFNVLNRANFALPVADLSDRNNFGRISSTVGNPRTLQVALRFSF
jgi:hypothetical protein